MDEPPNIPRTLKWRRPESSDSTDSPFTSEPCKISVACGTCEYINTPYRQSLEKKFAAGLDVLANAIDMNNVKVVPVYESPQKLHYRTHAKLAVRPSPEGSQYRFAIGLFKKGSHDIVDLQDCPLHRRSINRLIRDLKEILEDSSLAPYDEENLSGDLRYVTVRSTHTTDGLMLTFVVTRKLRSELKSIVNQLRSRGNRIVSAHMNLHSENNNAIFSDESTVLHGSRRIRETLCELSFELSPTSFFQVNPWTAQLCYRRIQQHAGRGSNNVAWDLYCGVGQISMVLAQQGYRVLGIEQNPQAARDAQSNATLNDLQSQLHFIAGRVEDVQGAIPEWAWPPELIVANPSRKGISDDMLPFLVRALNKSKSSRLIYMSCDVTTLARDLEYLTNQGYKVRQVEGFDMFPFTDKMEWIAVVTH